MGKATEDAVERAQHSAHISLVFEAAVRRVFTSFDVEMTRPEGGARAHLHIRLKAAGSSFSVGWVQPCDGTAELYTLGNTLARSKRAGGREQTLPPMQYSRFLEIAKRVLEDFGMTVTIVAFTCDDVEIKANDATEEETAEVEKALADTEPPEPGCVISTPHLAMWLERK